MIGLLRLRIAITVHWRRIAVTSVVVLIQRCLSTGVWSHRSSIGWEPLMHMWRRTLLWCSRLISRVIVPVLAIFLGRSILLVEARLMILGCALCLFIAIVVSLFHAWRIIRLVASMLLVPSLRMCRLIVLFVVVKGCARKVCVIVVTLLAGRRCRRACLVCSPRWLVGGVLVVCHVVVLVSNSQCQARLTRHRKGEELSVVK